MHGETLLGKPLRSEMGVSPGTNNRFTREDWVPPAVPSIHSTWANAAGPAEMVFLRSRSGVISVGSRSARSAVSVLLLTISGNGTLVIVYSSETAT